MKHKNIPLILLILFSAVTYNLYAQQKYWNEHTQLTPWRFPLTADKAGLTYEDLTTVRQISSVLSSSTAFPSCGLMTTEI